VARPRNVSTRSPSLTPPSHIYAFSIDKEGAEVTVRLERDTGKGSSQRLKREIERELKGNFNFFILKIQLGALDVEK